MQYPLLTPHKSYEIKGAKYQCGPCCAQLLALPEEQQLETLQAYMLAAAAEAAGIDELDPDQPLLELGLDSLRAAEFAVQVFSLLALLACCSQLP